MDVPIVIFSEVHNDPGLSITRAAEVVAGAVFSFHRLPKPVWIAHHPPEITDVTSETFDLVLFLSPLR